MAVFSWQNGARIVTLGEGTTYVGLALRRDLNEAGAIAFSNKPLAARSDMTGDEVMVEIVNQQGLLSYWRAGLLLLQTWDLSRELREQVEDLMRCLEEVPKA